MPDGPPADTWDPDDTDAVRQQIHQRVLTAASALEPIANTKHTLRLANVQYQGPETFTAAEQKQAVLEGRTLQRPLKGEWQLYDNDTGQLLDRKRTTVAHVPWYTPRGTFILNGTEFTLSNQSRLKSGVFARRKANGELEGHVNVLPGKGWSHRVFLDPQTGIFRVQFGQSRIPLVPLLQAFGTTDAQLKKAWGNELAAANLQKSDATAIAKLHRKLVRPGQYADLSPAAAVAKVIGDMELDPDVTAKTLGKPISRLGPEALLAITQKLLHISNGTAHEDDRDAMAYQQFLGPDDLLAERVGKSRQLLRKLLWKATAKRSVKHIPVGTFSPSLQAAIVSSGLGQPNESVNPAQVFDQHRRVSRMGTGGIGSTSAVPDEARGVQPSYLGFIDPVVTPESMRAGVDARFARRVRRGSKGQIYAPFTHAKTGKETWLTPRDTADTVIAFPQSLARNQAHVVALDHGKLQFVPREKVKYVLPAMEDAFAPIPNMVPMKSLMMAQRMAMAQRMLTQALPLVKPEAPLVRSGVPNEDRSFEAAYGRRMGAVRAPQAGRVLDVSNDAIHVRYADGREDRINLVANFPNNRKTRYHQTPLVRAGESFAPNKVLAKSNFTDNDGVAALGLNARVAYIPYKGFSFEDAIVVSEGLAKRLTSEQMYQQSLDADDDLRTEKAAFVSVFPSAFSSDTLKTLDDNGIVKPGTVVNEGDPLVLGVKKKPKLLNAMHSAREKSFLNRTETWDHETPGVVTDVSRTRKGITVSVKTTAPLKVGDKLSGRFGDKGVVGKIVPDDLMPHDKEGQPYELLLNPLGIISRKNPSQVIETALGKIAAKTGKPVTVHDFDKVEDLTEQTLKRLAEHGLSDTETLIDGETGRKIPNILTGNRFIMKLHHLAEAKGQGRGHGGYSAEEMPSKGGPTGSKKVSILHLNALLSHGALDVIRDATQHRGQAHTDYWRQVMSGRTPATPDVPLVYRKFVNSLRGAGINVLREGSRMDVMALTDDDITKLAGTRELQNAETVDWRDKLKPIRGGLFDESLTGSHGGSQWSYIKLPEPMPNPVMEEPMRRLLGLTQKTFRNVLAGREKLDNRTGPEALTRALQRIDLDKLLDETREQIKNGRKTVRDVAVRKLGYLKAAKRLGLHPKDWMLTKLPVLPPIFRPVSMLQGSKHPMVADINYLYKEAFDAADNLKSLRGQVADLSDERLALYDAFKAVTGLGQPTQPKNKEKNVKGLLKQIFGTSPKRGVVQQKLLGSTVDLVGRAAITPDPDLDFDSVAIPERFAWEVYQPLIVRRLVRNGVPRVRAAQEVTQRSQLARKALVSLMDDRPVIINRDPALHRYSMMAFWPRLTADDSMHVNPFIVGGFSADFDGDTMNLHVPAHSDAAKEAAEKMLPSRNLFSPASFHVHQLPSKEFLGGLYSASTDVDLDKPPRVFRNAQDAITAYRRGEIAANRRVEIVESD